MKRVTDKNTGTSYEAVREQFVDPFYCYYKAATGWRMDHPHFHEQYELLMFMCDHADLFIAGRTYHMRTGDLVLINGQSPHRVIIDDNLVYSRYIIMFEPSVMDGIQELFHVDLLHLFHDAGTPPVILRLSKGALERMEQCYQRIAYDRSLLLDNANDPWGMARIRTDLMHMLIDIHDLYQDETLEAVQPYRIGGDEVRIKVVDNERASQIRDYIDKHIYDRLELEDLAREFHLNKYYLSHYYKDKTHINLSDYITTRKMDAAKTMLREGVSVQEVADRLTFSSQSHFIQVFKRNVLMTPGQYAKKYGKNT